MLGLGLVGLGLGLVGLGLVGLGLVRLGLELVGLDLHVLLSRRCAYTHLGSWGDLGGALCAHMWSSCCII